MHSRVYAKEDRRLRTLAAKSLDPVFLTLVLLLLGVGLGMLYSASYAQSRYDTHYESSVRYLLKQGVCAVMGLVCGCSAAYPQSSG